MRNIKIVIDQIKTKVPKYFEHRYNFFEELDCIVNEAMYTAPEAMHLVWGNLCGTISHYLGYPNEVWKKDIASIIEIIDSTYEYEYNTNKSINQINQINQINSENTLIVTTNSIGNISLNMLNKVHCIYFTKSTVSEYETDNTISNNIFYIKLHKKYQPMKNNIIIHDNKKYMVEYKFAKADIIIDYMHYGGIHVNDINAEFSTTMFRKRGYHCVKTVGQNYITIQLDRVGYYNDKRFRHSESY